MMKPTRLKRFRVIISLLFLLATAFLFLDFTQSVSPTLTTAIVYLQFVPSLLTFLQVMSLAALGFVIVLILTVLFGRVFCSTICPLGTLQDIIIHFAEKLRKNKKKVRFKFTKPHNVLRYTILIMTVLSFMGGSLMMINLLDPFSNFGRIVANVFRPLYLGFNNILAQTFAYFDIYSLFYPINFKVNLLTLAFPLLILGLLIGLTLKHGRLYCNTLCPLGTLLGLVAKYSLFQIKIDSALCTTCAQCSIKCKASCIQLKTKEIDFSRCVACFNCMSVCPGLGIDYQNTWTQTPAFEASRRIFLNNTFISVASLSGLAPKHITNSQPTTIQPQKTAPVAPPGAGRIDDFTHACIACHLCVSACPTQVLQPAVLNYGFTGMLQPRMDFHFSFCNYECTVCTEICPTPALSPLTETEKKRTQIGKVKFIKENCVVYTDETDCGACDEHCPTKAVNLIPYKIDLAIPEVDEELCVGCGACEYICPVRPYRAIYVDGNPEHLTAKLPEVKVIEIEVEEDFPF